MTTDDFQGALSGALGQAFQATGYEEHENVVTALQRLERAIRFHAIVNLAASLHANGQDTRQLKKSVDEIWETFFGG